MANESVRYVLDLQDRFSGPLARVSAHTQKFDKTFDRLKAKTGGAMSAISGVASKLTSLAAIAGAGLGISKVIEVTSAFEKYDAVLTNAFGSARAASEAQDLLIKKAQALPVSLNELTASYVKLVNRGLIPTSRNITQLSDLASSQGKSFDQLTEAILDAQTGEFERLKEFGVIAKQSGDKVALTFKGITSTVPKSSQAISDYVLSLGSLKGVAGTSAIQMNTLAGRISNLGDKFDMFLLKVGKMGGGVMGKGIDAVSALLDRVGNGLDVLSANGDKIKEIFAPLEPLLASITRLWNRFADSIGVSSGGVSMLEKALSGLSWYIDTLQPYFDGLSKAFDNLGGSMEGIITIGKAIGAVFGQLFKGVATFAGKFVEGISNSIAGLSKVVEGLIKHDLSKIGQGVLQAAKGSFQTGISVYQGAATALFDYSERGKSVSLNRVNQEKGKEGLSGASLAEIQARKMAEQRGTASLTGAGADKVAGAAVRNITLNTTVNMGGLTIATQTLKQGAMSIRKEVEDILGGLLEDTRLIQSAV